MGNITLDICHIVLLCVFAVTLPVTWAVGDVTIPDPALEIVIRNERGLGPTDPIRASDLAGIINLCEGDFPGLSRGIRLLDGLQYCINLV